MEINFKINTENTEEVTKAIKMLQVLNPVDDATRVYEEGLKRAEEFENRSNCHLKEIVKPKKKKAVKKADPIKEAVKEIEKVAETIKEDLTPAPKTNGVTIGQLRGLLSEKVTDHRAAIKAKLTDFEAKNISSLDENKYKEFYDFLNLLK